MFIFVITSIKVGRFWQNLVCSFLNKFAAKSYKHFLPHVNNDSTLPCETWNAHCICAITYVYIIFSENLFRKICTEFHQNCRVLQKILQKHFGLSFSGHSVHTYTLWNYWYTVHTCSYENRHFMHDNIINATTINIKQTLSHYIAHI